MANAMAQAIGAQFAMPERAGYFRLSRRCGVGMAHGRFVDRAPVETADQEDCLIFNTKGFRLGDIEG